MADDKEKNKESEANELDDLDDLDGEPPKKSKKKLIIIAVVLLLGGGGAGAFFTGALDSVLGGGHVVEDLTDEHGEATEGHGEESADGHKKALESFVDEQMLSSIVYYDLPEFLVNLNTGGKKTSFLKVIVTLEIASLEVSKKITNIKPRIIDDFNTYLRELRSTDLQGSAGIYRLREELLMRVNKAMYPLKVNDVLFKEILVQ